MLRVTPRQIAKSGARLLSTRAALFQAARPVSSQNNSEQTKASSTTYSPLVFSERKGSTILPVNVEALYHEPLRHAVKHKHLAAELHLRSYGIQSMDFFINFALRAAYYLGIPITGPLALPSKMEKWTVIRAPFVHAKSKENFERKTHKRVVKAWDASPETIDLWLSVLNKHSIAGVGVKANVFVRESLAALKEMEDVSFDIDDSSPYLKKGAAVNSDLVAQRVSELLKDPVFKKHLEPKVEKVEK